MESFKTFAESGLWDNIRKKRARGEPMRKKGEKGAPTAAAMAKAKGEANESKGLSPAEKKIVNQMYDRKGNLTPLGKKVMNHGKKPGDKGYVEDISLDEAPYVAAEMDIVDSLWNEIREKMFKDKRNKRLEKHWPFIQVLAKYAGFKVTKKGQDKDKIFRFDVKK